MMNQQWATQPTLGFTTRHYLFNPFAFKTLYSPFRATSSYNWKLLIDRYGPFQDYLNISKGNNREVSLDIYFRLFLNIQVIHPYKINFLGKVFKYHTPKSKNPFFMLNYWNKAGRFLLVHVGLSGFSTSTLEWALPFIFTPLWYNTLPLTSFHPANACFANADVEMVE